MIKMGGGIESATFFYLLLELKIQTNYPWTNLFLGLYNDYNRFDKAKEEISWKKASFLLGFLGSYVIN